MAAENNSTWVWGVGFLAFSFAIGMALESYSKEQYTIAKQIAYEKWSNKERFLSTLSRYNEIYHRLASDHSKKDLASAYVKMLTDDLFLFPSKRSSKSTVSVLLPAGKTKQPGEVTVEQPYVLQEIYIGADNGLYDALRTLIRGREVGYQQPPFVAWETSQLLEYIKTGDQGILKVLEKGEAVGEAALK